MDTIEIGRYRHYKGREFTVIGVAIHSETEEELVVYRKEFDDHGLRVRPKDQFLGVVEAEGEMVPRFRYSTRRTGDDGNCSVNGAPMPCSSIIARRPWSCR
jgi:hypothetical protein